jgi:uncharacterized protein (TIGR02246 family)
MRWFSSLGLLGLAVTMSASLAAQQATQAEHDVLQVQTERNKALLTQDVKALESILADELLWCHSSAALENKTQFLERVRSGASQWLKLEPHGMKVHVYGDAAVVTGQLQQTTTGPGRKPADRTLQTIEVFVKRDGRWRLADFQGTAVPDRQSSGNP